jgi:DNA-binding beta-propeller fold protein YncE
VGKPRFEQLTRTIAASGTRRTLTQGLAALLLSAQAVSLPDEATARRKHRRDRPQAEKKNKKTVTLCLNGETIEVKKSKKQKYLKQGATLGACQTCDASSWVKETDFGSFGSGASEFDFPNSVAIASSGLTAWVADAQNYRISVWSRPAADSTVWSNTGIIGTPGSGPSDLSGPECVRVAPDEKTMWIMDTLNNRVSVWTRPDTSAAWANQTTFGSGGSGPDQFDFPSRIAVSADELTVWVADHGHNRVSVWGRPSAGSTVWGHKGNFGTLGSGPNDLHGPTGVAVDQDGLTAWVSDYGNNRISVWERSNASSDTWINQTTFGAPGSGANSIDQPLGLAVSPDGLTAWICDNHGNQRVSIWTRPNAGSTAWAYAGAFGDPCADIALSPDLLTAWLAEPSTNSISVWTMTCPA